MHDRLPRFTFATSGSSCFSLISTQLCIHACISVSVYQKGHRLTIPDMTGEKCQMCLVRGEIDTEGAPPDESDSFQSCISISIQFSIQIYLHILCLLMFWLYVYLAEYSLFTLVFSLLVFIWFSGSQNIGMHGRE